MTPNRDYDWNYEYVKTDKVTAMIESGFEYKPSSRSIKIVVKKFEDDYVFYDEHTAKALNIIKKYKED